MSVKATLVKNTIPSADKIIKNVKFGMVVGFTKTAKEAQQAVIGAIRGTFTVRNNWLDPKNAMGIKIKPATKQSPQAIIRTRADWLLIHEKGGDKKSRSGGRLAIPTDEFRGGKFRVIPKSKRPKALMGKRTFILNTSKGEMIFQRKFYGKRSRIDLAYALETSVRIKKQSTFYEPIEKVVRRRLNANVKREVIHALKTMRP